MFFNEKENKITGNFEYSNRNERILFVAEDIKIPEQSLEQKC